MSNIVSLNFDKHSHLRVQASLRHRSAVNQHLMPLVPAEFGRASTCFPIIVTKNADTGEFTFSAMMGFQPGENLFVREGRWDADYEPLQIQRQPFFVGDDHDSKVVCFDSESLALSADDGELLFNSKSQASDYLQTVEQILNQLMGGEIESQKLVTQLVDLKLLTPFSLDIEFNDGTKQAVQGAYMIDENRMAELDDQAVLRLYRSGVIGLMHNVQNSMHQLPNLIARKNRMLDTAKSWFESA
ncbi:MAG: SapC family protein [Arenicella sp.]|nr:SapC family protein [Arenicella sp.]